MTNAITTLEQRIHISVDPRMWVPDEAQLDAAGAWWDAPNGCALEHLATAVEHITKYHPGTSRSDLVAVVSIEAFLAACQDSFGALVGKDTASLSRLSVYWQMEVKVDESLPPGIVVVYGRRAAAYEDPPAAFVIYGVTAPKEYAPPCEAEDDSSESAGLDRVNAYTVGYRDAYRGVPSTEAPAYMDYRLPWFEGHAVATAELAAKEDPALSDPYAEIEKRLASLEARIKEHDSYLYIAGKRTDKSITELWEDLSDVRSERERAHDLVSSRLDALEDRERTFEDRVRNLEFTITSAEKEVLDLCADVARAHERIDRLVYAVADLRQPVEAPEAAASPDPGDHPQQRIITDENGERRFRANPLVVYLYDTCPRLSLNQLSKVPASDADRRQFAQLIGYSVDGYLERDYAMPIKYDNPGHAPGIQDDDGAES